MQVAELSKAFDRNFQLKCRRKFKTFGVKAIARQEKVPVSVVMKALDLYWQQIANAVH